MTNIHTFAICAYKESPYLVSCIESLLKQSVKSNIIITTSTPVDVVKEVSKKYNLPLFINQKHIGIGDDWNFALKKSESDFVTIVHQDDLYATNFAKFTLKAIKSDKDALLAFTDYREILNDQPQKLSKLLKAKKLSLWPISIFPQSKIVRKAILSLGTPICCPSVTINKKILGNKIFSSELKTDLDWQAWLKIADQQGSFKYINKELVFHRVHADSETNRQICSNTRLKEDIVILSSIWPKAISNFIQLLYKNYFKAYKEIKNEKF